jgi:hypothetical protein
MRGEHSIAAFTACGSQLGPVELANARQAGEFDADQIDHPGMPYKFRKSAS